MSQQKRIIKHYTLNFVRDSEPFFDEALFLGFIRFINELPDENRIIDDEKISRAHAIQLIEITSPAERPVHVHLAMKSCKYNHSPNYMSRIDGSERSTSKALDEGEKELTHLAILLGTYEAYMVFEVRRSGIAIGSLIKYLNVLFSRFKDAEGLEDVERIEYCVVPGEDFLDALEKTRRVSEVQIYTTKEILGSDFLQLAASPETVQDEAVLLFRAKRTETVPRNYVRDIFRSISPQDRITRVRIKGKDENNADALIDSLRTAVRNEITVQLEERGTVSSESIFLLMDQVLHDIDGI